MARRAMAWNLEAVHLQAVHLQARYRKVWRAASVRVGEPRRRASPMAPAQRRSVPAQRQAPLRVRGKRLGVIGTRSAEPHEYHASDLKVLTAIASLTAPTLDQAAVHEAVIRGATADSDRP
jgi:hypothetical protein